MAKKSKSQSDSAKSTGRKFFQIDERALDREWLRQSDLYDSYAKRVPKAQRALDQAEAEVKVIAAEIDQKIRKRPERYGVEKGKSPTEKLIETLIVIQPEHQAVIARVIAKKFKVRILEAALRTLEHKKRALEKLVDLHGRNYFGEPFSTSMSKVRREKLSGDDAADDD